MKYIREVTGVSASAWGTYLTTDLNPKPSDTIAELLGADPFIRLLRLYVRELRAVRCHVRYDDSSIYHLRIEGRNPLIKGFRVLRRSVIEKRRNETASYAYPSWTRRRSLSAYGDVTHQPRSLITNEFAQWESPGGFNTHEVSSSQVVVGAGLSKHLTFDDFRAFANSLMPFVGSQFKTLTSGLGVYARCTLQGLDVEADYIRYSLTDVFHQSYPGSNYALAPHLNVEIFRGSAGDMTITFLGFDGIKIIRGSETRKATYPNIRVAKSIVIRDNDLDLRRRYASQLGHVFGHHVMTAFKPALFHSQGKALNSLLIQYDKNFENFVESPELFALVNSLNKAKEFSPDVLGADPWIERLKKIALLFAGIQLSWAFALKPTLDAIREQVKPLLLPLKGEASIAFSNRALSSLPNGLQSVLLSRTSADYHSASITSVTALFRTEAHTVPDEITIARTIMESDIFARLGLYPSLKQIWETAPFSFVADWWLSIGRRIDDLSAYLRAPTLETRIGHTAHILVDLENGLVFDLFHRSGFNRSPTDPPSDSWLESPGAPTIAIPLAVSMLLSGGRSKGS